LVESKLVEVDEQRKGDISGLHIACSNGDIETVKYLLNKGADVNKESNFGTAIIWAISSKKSKRLELI